VHAGIVRGDLGDVAVLAIAPAHGIRRRDDPAPDRGGGALGDALHPDRFAGRRDHFNHGLDRLSRDWERVYGHPVYFAETFIDPGRFRGTCYRAANWRSLGLTTGRGKASTSKRPNRSIKEVLGYPLTPRFRELLKQS
jgi:Domain of unknown function (DUF4338)